MHNTHTCPCILTILKSLPYACILIYVLHCLRATVNAWFVFCSHNTDNMLLSPQNREERHSVGKTSKNSKFIEILTYSV